MMKFRVWLGQQALSASLAIANAGFSLGCILMHGKGWRERRAQYVRQGNLQNHFREVMRQ